MNHPIFVLPLNTTLEQLKSIEYWASETRRLDMYEFEEVDELNEMVFHSSVKPEYLEDLIKEVMQVGGRILVAEAPWRLYANIPIGTMRNL